MTDIFSDEEAYDEDDKGEMVYVYQSDLRVIRDWIGKVVQLSGHNHFADMNDREAEAWAALEADAES